jgi:hypothetical protein
MSLLSDWGMEQMMIEPAVKVNRAFSAGALVLRNPGAMPQAGGECCAFGANMYLFQGR